MGHEQRANDERRRMRDARVEDESKDWVIVIDGSHNWIGKLNITQVRGALDGKAETNATAFVLEPVYEIIYVQIAKGGRLSVLPQLLPVLGMSVRSLVLNPERTTIALAELEPGDRARLWEGLQEERAKLEQQARLNRAGLVGPGVKQ